MATISQIKIGSSDYDLYDPTIRTEIDTKIESQRGIFKSTVDAGGTSDTTDIAPLIVGNPAGNHLEFDSNEIMAKASANTVGKLYINNDGGAVYLNANPISGTLTKNTVWAAPNGSNGAPTMRALVAADIPDLAASKITSGTLDVDRIPDLAASKITSETFATARIPNLAATKITSGTLDPARNTAIEAFTSQITAGSNCTVNTGAVRRYGRLIWLIAYIQYNKTFTINDNGEITDLTLGTVKSNYIPNGNSCIWTGRVNYGTTSDSSNTRYRFACGLINTSGVITVQSCGGAAVSQAVRAGAEFQFTAMYYHNTPA